MHRMFQVNHMKTRLSIQSRNIAGMVTRKACRTAFGVIYKEKNLPSVLLVYEVWRAKISVCIKHSEFIYLTLQDSWVKKLVIHFQQAKTTPAILQLVKRKDWFWKFNIRSISITKVPGKLGKDSRPSPPDPAWHPNYYWFSKTNIRLKIWFLTHSKHEEQWQNFFPTAYGILKLLFQGKCFLIVCL